MFFPEGQVRIFVYGEPVNMRLSYDGLYAKIRNVMGKDPMSGHLFAFINRRATQMKVMYWDRSGFCIWSKRLEEERQISNWSVVQTREMDWTGLKLLLEGIEIKRIKKRYFRAKTSAEIAITIVEKPNRYAAYGRIKAMQTASQPRTVSASDVAALSPENIVKMFNDQGAEIAQLRH